MARCQSVVGMRPGADPGAVCRLHGGRDAQRRSDRLRRRCGEVQRVSANGARFVAVDLASATGLPGAVAAADAAVGSVGEFKLEQGFEYATKKGTLPLFPWHMPSR